MARTNIRVTGVNEAIRKMNRLGAAFAERNVEPVLVGGAEIHAAEARRRAPRGATGDLSRSIVAKAGRRRGNIVAYSAVDMSLIRKRDKSGRRVRYPYFVEYGTSRMKARRYFRRALRTTRQAIRAHVERGLRAVAAKAVR